MWPSKHNRGKQNGLIAEANTENTFPGQAELKTKTAEVCVCLCDENEIEALTIIVCSMCDEMKRGVWAMKNEKRFILNIIYIYHTWYYCCCTAVACLIFLLCSSSTCIYPSIPGAYCWYVYMCLLC